MATFIKIIKDKDGNVIYPRTSVDAVEAGDKSLTDLIEDSLSFLQIKKYVEKLVTLSNVSGSIDLELGNVFSHSPTTNITYSFSNAESGKAHSFTLIVTIGSSLINLTFPQSVKWSGEPEFEEETTYILSFLTIDGGSTWYGFLGGEF